MREEIDTHFEIHSKKTLTSGIHLFAAVWYLNLKTTAMITEELDLNYITKRPNRKQFQ